MWRKRSHNGAGSRWSWMPRPRIWSLRFGKGMQVAPRSAILHPDNPPLTIRSGSGATRVGAQQGRPPDLSDPGLGAPTGPRVSNEVAWLRIPSRCIGVEFNILWMQAQSGATRGRMHSTNLRFAQSSSSAKRSHRQRSSINKNPEPCIKSGSRLPDLDYEPLQPLCGEICLGVGVSPRLRCLKEPEPRSGAIRVGAR